MKKAQALLTKQVNTPLLYGGAIIKSVDFVALTLSKGRERDRAWDYLYLIHLLIVWLVTTKQKLIFTSEIEEEWREKTT